MDILRHARDLGLRQPSEMDVIDRLRSACAELEVEHACFASKIPGNDMLVGFATYSESWRRHYIEQGHHLVDPTLQSMMYAMGPVDWERLRHLEGYGIVFSDALDFQIPSTGMSIPVRGPFGERSVLTLATRAQARDWASQKREIMQQVQQVAAQLHDEVMHSGRIMLSLDLPSLSTREIEILQWIAAGKSQQDVADILNISNRTVEVHLRSTRSKLGVVTTAQAVARAVGMQLIYPL